MNRFKTNQQVYDAELIKIKTSDKTTPFVVKGRHIYKVNDDRANSKFVRPENLVQAFTEFHTSDGNHISSTDSAKNWREKKLFGSVRHDFDWVTEQCKVCTPFGIGTQAPCGLKTRKGSNQRQSSYVVFLTAAKELDPTLFTFAEEALATECKQYLF